MRELLICTLIASLAVCAFRWAPRKPAGESRRGERHRGGPSE